MDANSVEHQKITAKFLGQHLVLSTATPSTFSFRQTFIQYLKEHVIGRILLKLMKSNKYFIPENFKLNSSSSISSSYTWNVGDIEKKDITENFFQKCLCCEFQSIRIFNSILKFNDLKQLISGGNIKHILLYEVTVLDNYGKDVVLIDDIIDLTPKLRGLYLVGKIFASVTGEIAKKLLQTNLNFIRFIDIPESFDFQTFVDVIKEKPDMIQIELGFDDSISAEHVARVIAGCPRDYLSPSWNNSRNMTEAEIDKYRLMSDLFFFLG